MILKGIILAILCSFVSFFIHLVISFFRKRRQSGEPLVFELVHQTKMLFYIWFLSFLIYAVLFFWGSGKIHNLINDLSEIREIVGFAYGLFLYLILSFIYLTVYYFICRSISGTILEIIENSPGKKLTSEEIKKMYNVEEKYQKELKGMLEGRFIIKTNGYYKNSFKACLYAKMSKLIKTLLKLGPGD